MGLRELNEIRFLPEKDIMRKRNIHEALTFLGELVLAGVIAILIAFIAVKIAHGEKIPPSLKKWEKAESIRIYINNQSSFSSNASAPTVSTAPELPLPPPSASPSSVLNHTNNSSSSQPKSLITVKKGDTVWKLLEGRLGRAPTHREIKKVIETNHLKQKKRGGLWVVIITPGEKINIPT